MTKLVRGCVDRAKADRSYLTTYKRPLQKLNSFANSARGEEHSQKQAELDEVVENASSMEAKPVFQASFALTKPTEPSSASGRAANYELRPLRGTLARRERSKSPLFKDAASKSPMRYPTGGTRADKLVLKVSNLSHLTNAPPSFPLSKLKSSGNGPVANHLTKLSTVKKKPTRLRVDEVPGTAEALKVSKFEDFVIGDLIGQGAYATSYFAYHNPSGVTVAFKVYTFGEKPVLKNAIDTEERLLRKLEHPNIVRLFARFDRPNKTYFVLE